MAISCEFAVCDVETTGFGKNDRIVEIAIARLNGSGEIVREFATLVNPNRDLGPTHVHKITAREITSAPTFLEVAGDVISLLTEAVFTAHNAAFDARFISKEMRQLGLELPEFPKLCTMQVACHIDPLVPNRALEGLCEYFGINYFNRHSAEDDVRATVELLRLALRLPESRREQVAVALGFDRPTYMNLLWPKIPALGKQVKRCTTSATEEASYLQRLVSKLPSLSNVTTQVTEYFSFLDRILADRRITEAEIAAAEDLAGDLGLFKEQIDPLHEKYLKDLAGLALANGSISEFESRDLHDVARLLGIESARCMALIDATVGSSEESGARIERAGVVITALSGKTICFSGEFQREIDGERVTRDLVERLVTEKGLHVRKTVTKDLDYLVVADPESLSSKAKRARQYGTQIIAEPVFWSMIGIT